MARSTFYYHLKHSIVEDKYKDAKDKISAITAVENIVKATQYSSRGQGIHSYIQVHSCVELQGTVLC